MDAKAIEDLANAVLAEVAKIITHPRDAEFKAVDYDGGYIIKPSDDAA